MEQEACGSSAVPPVSLLAEMGNCFAGLKSYKLHYKKPHLNYNKEVELKKLQGHEKIKVSHQVVFFMYNRTAVV